MSWALGSAGGSAIELREAIWEFVQRHVLTRLLRHASRGNLNGLQNFLDVYRTLCSLLLTWHGRVIEGQPVMSAGFVTNGLQQVISSLVGTRPGTAPEQRGFVQAIQISLSCEEKLVRDQLERHRVAATVIATLEELINVRCAARNCSPNDGWSNGRRAWVLDWLATIKLAHPNDDELREVGAEFRIAA